MPLILTRQFFLDEDGTQPVLVETQMESVFVRKLRDLFLAILLVYRPDALQFILVNSALREFASLQLQIVSDLFGENFHTRPRKRLG